MKDLRLALLGSALCVCLFPVAPGAQTLETEPVEGEIIETEPVETAPLIIVTATRLDNPIVDVPAAVTVIEQNEIEGRNLTLLDQALQGVPGVNIVRSGGLGQQTSLFLRGTNSNQTLVLFDRIPVQDPSTPNGAFDFGLDTLAGVGRIELVRGPGSTLYGNNAIGGVINIIPVVGGDDPVNVDAEMAYGTEATLSATATARGTVGDFDYGLTFERFSTEGYNIVPADTPGNRGEEDGFQSTALTGRFAADLSETVRLDGVFRYRNSDTDIDNFGTDDPNFRLENEHTAWRLGGEVDWWGEHMTARLDVGQSIYDRASLNEPDEFNPSAFPGKFDATTTFVNGQNAFDVGAIGPADDVRLLAGFDYRRESVDVDFFGELSRAQETVGYFGQAEATWWDRVTTLAQIRYEDAELFDEETTYRLGMSIDLDEIDSRAYAAVGTAFRAPTIAELFADGGNPNLQPETSFSWEVGFETDFDLFGRPDGITLAATYFNIQTDDLILFDFEEEELVNIGEAESEGVETAITLRPSEAVEGTFSWTYTDARNAITGERLDRRPEHILAARVTVQTTDDLQITPEVLFVSEQTDFGDTTIPSYTLVGLSANYAFTDQAEAFVRFDNLFDEDYENPNGFVGRGFNALAGVRVSF
ncbi:MAG: TonB-dependent receptor [Pseudomonadota bacterium]